MKSKNEKISSLLGIMDYRSGNRCLIRQSTCSYPYGPIPEQIIAELTLKLDCNDDIIQTFASIEQCHWDYLDNYRSYNRRRYPNYKIIEFTTHVFQQKGYVDHINDIPEWTRMYNRYKKSLPTAGVIMYHLSTDANDVQFVTVKMRNSCVWSMPKGKKDTCDSSIMNTAAREFMEETGIDVEDCINANTPSKTLNKTLFYLVEADEISNKFNGFNRNEIGAVCWSSARCIMNNLNNYSKQTVSVAKHLLNRYC